MTINLATTLGTTSSDWDPRLQEVDPQTLKQWLDQQRVTVVDVREPSEFAEERIPGAVNMPLSSFDPTRVPRSTPDHPVVMQCRTGNRSMQASRRLLDAGWEEVIHLQGGLERWKQLRFPLTRTANAPISIMRQVQITAGSLVVLGTVLGAFVSPWWLLLSGFVGSGLIFAGVTNTCGMALLLARMPWNQGH